MPLRRIKYYRDTEGEVNKLSKLFILFALIIVSILFVSVFGTVTYYAVTLDLPSVETLKDYRPSIASCVYDDNDEIIDEFFLEDRKIVDIKNVPKVVQYAFVASEDSRFYQHKGFDIKSIPISHISSRLERVDVIFSPDNDEQLSDNEITFLNDSRRATTDSVVRKRRSEFLVNLMGGV